MKSWQMKIECPEDLPILRDLLLDEGHPGAEVVEWLVEKGKFPGRFQASTRPDDYAWYWAEEPTPDYPQVLDEVFWSSDDHEFHSATEAIWAVINAKLYREFP